MTLLPLTLLAFWIGLYPGPFFRILDEPDFIDGRRVTDLLPLAQSTVSQHLKSLKEAGLIKGEVEGPAICYCIDKTVFGKFKNRFFKGF